MSRKTLVPANVLASASAPTSPTLRAGDIYFNTAESKLYAYTGSTWVAASGATSGGSSVSVGTEPPTGATQGDLWFESDSTRMFIYYDSYWVEASSPVAAVGLLDGGAPNSTYGGIAPIDAGSVA